MGDTHHDDGAVVCLVMIVKNEARIMRRCLDQLVGLIDYVCISDTGSTDDTVSIIESFIEEKKAQQALRGGAVFHHAWKNFGHNRTLSSRAAQRWLLKERFPEPATTSSTRVNIVESTEKDEDDEDEEADADGPEGFVTPGGKNGGGTREVISLEDPDKTRLASLKNVVFLMLDADMRLWVHPRHEDQHFRHLATEQKEDELRRCREDERWLRFWKESLIQEAMGMINQWGPNIIYPNIRFMRADQWITCLGPTHEYYCAADPLTGADVPSRLMHRSCSIEDIGDGGSKSDKFERDIRLLKEGIEEEPDNCRYWFYLGNSYKNHGDHEKAIEAYRKRVAFGGWVEEIFMSHLYMGECYEIMNRQAEALLEYFKGYDAHPQRSETLYRASVLSRKMNMYRVSEMATEKGAAIRIPPGGGLFIEPNVYEYLFTEETSISSYYTNKKELGKKACLRILSLEGVHPIHRDLAEKNIKFY